MAFIIISGISKLFLKINRKNYISNKTRTPSTLLTHFGKISAIYPHFLTSTCQVQQTLFQEASIDRP